MAFSTVALDRGHMDSRTRVASCFRGVSCPYTKRGLCWFRHVSLCCVAAATAPVPDVQLVERIQKLIVALDDVLWSSQSASPGKELWDPRGKRRPRGSGVHSHLWLDSV